MHILVSSSPWRSIHQLVLLMEWVVVCIVIRVKMKCHAAVMKLVWALYQTPYFSVGGLTRARARG